MITPEERAGFGIIITAISTLAGCALILAGRITGHGTHDMTAWDWWGLAMLIPGCLGIYMCN